MTFGLVHSTALVALILIVHLFVASSAFVLNQGHSSAASRQLAVANTDNIVIQQIEQDNHNGLEEFSCFCIDIFHNNKEKSDSFVYGKLKDIKMSMLQTAQMLDLSVPVLGNRSVFIARTCKSNDKDANLTNIIGCCEVIEERIIISKEKNANAQRIRPIIENLAVKEEYRRQGVAKALLEAVEQNVQTWIPLHDDIYTQVEETNPQAKEFFLGNNYEVVYVDIDCKKDDLNGLLFSQTKITKLMMRKVLHL